MGGNSKLDEVYKCKVVMVGEQAVGKSSLVLQFVNNTFQDNYKCTIGASFLTKKVSIDNKILQFDIWDTAGLERFQSIVPMYYRGAHAALIVYDVTNLDSFTRAKKWVAEIKEKADTVAVIALVGNKSDRKVYRSVPYEDGGTYATERNLLFTETSAKTGENVDNVFLEIAKVCASKKAWNEPAAGRMNGRLNLNKTQSSSKKGCC